MSATAVAHPSTKKFSFPIPFNSVRGGVTVGFLVLVVMLIGVVAVSASMVRKYQSDTSEMYNHAAAGNALREAEANSITSALLTMRYVLSGGETYPDEIRGSALLATKGIEDARRLAIERGDDAAVAKLDTLLVTQNQLTSDEGIESMIAFRQNGQIPEAIQQMEAAVPIYRDFRIGLNEAADEQLQMSADLRAEADRTGNVAFWLLVISGAVGAAFGVGVAYLIVRSIVRPLSRLEATAIAVSRGDFAARSSVDRPRELAQLSDTLNFMMSTVHEHTAAIEERNRQLLDARFQAATDGLTGIYNHRSFQERIREQVTDCAPGSSFSLIMLDIDSFKRVNDTLGHQVGDEILRSVAQVCTATAGNGTAYRYGGDEIAVVLPNTTLAAAHETAEKLRLAASEAPLPTPITISIGVAAYPTTATSAEELIHQADSAMYAAKSEGKNRVRAWAPDADRAEDVA